MEKSENSKDKRGVVIKAEEHFRDWIKGHEKILEAIGKL